MYEWLNDTLIAIKFVAEGLGYWKVLELPARQTEVQAVRRRFGELEQAEQYIEDQWPPEILRVDPMDLTEEIVRRNTYFARFLDEEE